MGTNYYWKPDGQDSIHIGKSSGGWCFALHVTEELTSLDDWKAELKKPGYIQNEYGEVVTPEDMLKIITVRAWAPSSWKCAPTGYSSWAQFHECNHSEPGPNGLVRHKIGEHCVGHGEGPWDYCPGKFS
jgi:hypothetical protein